MIADTLLSRLDGVRQTGADRWLALCPAHDDKRPSLSVREIDDRLLVHCWAGCSVQDVIVAVGLTFDALYSERTTHRCKPDRRPFPAADVLRALEYDALIAAVAAATVRVAEAEKLGVRVGTLDNEVSISRRTKEEEGGAPTMFPTVTPWSEAVSGAALLSEGSAGRGYMTPNHVKKMALRPACGVGWVKQPITDWIEQQIAASRKVMS